MTKLDPPRAGPDGEVRPHLSDAKAALRGFARSRLDGKLVLSAGINPGLYSYLEEFPCFSRDADGHIRKPVVLKISDLRSASIQGKFLAKKGIELSELRIESGLNCGGHVFPTEGELLGPIVEQVIAERERFPQIFEPLLEQHAAAHGRTLHQGARNRRIPITVQGGVGNQGEMRRLLEGYGVDAVGWASPFLLVPEVVLLDARTRAQLEAAGADELYVSDASPLGVRFNNLRGSSSAEWQRARIEAGTPGSGCPNGYVANNAEFSERPICTGSSDYQKRKLQALGYATPPKWSEAGDDAKAVYAKECICQHLGNGTLQALGLVRTDLPVAVCPGPNLAYFDRSYSLEEMVDHIYGRRESLVPADRPHLFAKELDLYLAHYRELERTTSGPRAARSLRAFREGLLSGLAHYRALCERPAYPGENLASLGRAVEEAAAGLALVPSLLAQEERSART